MKTRIKLVVLYSVAFLIVTLPALANKSSVAIEAPATAIKDEMVTITLKVSHQGNNLIHHTMWAYVKVNGAEVGRWEWKKKHFESGNFTRQITVKAEKTLAIEAEASCNFHGSAGMKQAAVEVK
jgi:desulfoferrodoxin (superoxide reductase-like protein)